jgi:hypothetical protein
LIVCRGADYAMKLTLLSLAAAAAASCVLPSQYNWTSTDALAEPQDWISLRDFTTAPYKGKTLVYATTFAGPSKWSSMSFGLISDWSEMGYASQTALESPTVSPNLIYFAPKDIWVLAYQWTSTLLSYRTSKDPSDPKKWSEAKGLLPSSVNLPRDCVTGPIDAALIGDDERMHLFWACDNGRIYRVDMPIGDFPGTFGADYEVALEDQNKLNVFEAPQIYRLKDQQKYLMTVEAIGRVGRFMRSFTSDSLTGAWVPNAATEGTPFAGYYNSDADWTKDVSQGELVRVSADQTMTVDPCNLELLYTGYDPRIQGGFNEIPYRPAVLTLAR